MSKFDFCEECCTIKRNCRAYKKRIVCFKCMNKLQKTERISNDEEYIKLLRLHKGLNYG